MTRPIADEMRRSSRHQRLGVGIIARVELPGFAPLIVDDKAAHAALYNTFYTARHLTTRSTLRTLRGPTQRHPDDDRAGPKTAAQRFIPMLNALSQPLRHHLIRQVRAAVNGAPDGRPTIIPSDNAYFAPGSIVRQVHGDVTSMMVGGIAALLLQMLHPAVLAGVWDHSNFRADMAGRLHRTARFIAVTSFGDRADADDAIARVRKVHAALGGTLLNGDSYRADDPTLLAWVHVSEAVCFYDAWARFGSGSASAEKQDAYFSAFGLIAEKLGASPVPRSRAEANAFITSLRPSLKADERTGEVVRLLADPPGASPSRRPAYRLLWRSAIDLLPPWARALHGFPPRQASDYVARAGTAALAQTLRWAFVGEQKR